MDGVPPVCFRLKSNVKEMKNYRMKTQRKKLKRNKMPMMNGEKESQWRKKNI